MPDQAGRARWLVRLMAAIALLGGCTPQETPPESAVHTNIDELSELIVLAHRPHAAWWRTRAISASRAPGPTDWQLVAVLEYDKQVMEGILRQSTALPANNAMPMTLPEEFRMHGKPEAPGYSPGMFARSPLLHGRLAQLRGTNKLLLILYSR